MNPKQQEYIIIDYETYHNNIQNNKKNIYQKSPVELAEEVSYGRWRSAPHLNLLNDKLLNILNKNDAATTYNYSNNFTNNIDNNFTNNFTNNFKNKNATNQHNKLIINMPPRHGKSEFTSLYFLFWYAVNFPQNNVIFVSYNNSIASFFGKKLINLIETDGEKYGLKINKRSKSAKEFMLEYFDINNEIINDKNKDKDKDKVNSNGNEKNNSKSNTQRGGTYSFTGIGGTLTGKGASLIVIDDPIKNSFDAFNSNKRNQIWDWYQSTLFTRLEPNASIIIVMTRWHKDDLCGKILDLAEKFQLQHNEKIDKLNSEMANSIKFINNTHSNFSQSINTHSESITNKIDENIKYLHKLQKYKNELNKTQWQILLLPAIAEQNDPLGRKVGEPLWEDRFDLSELEEIKNTLGDFWFSAMYQQQPMNEFGAIFDKQYFRYYTDDGSHFIINNGNGGKQKINKSNLTFYITLDLAISSKSSADYTVLIVFAEVDGIIFIVDIFRQRISPTQHINIIQEYVNIYNPAYVGIESVQYQTSLITEAINLGIPATELIPRGKKEIRAIPITMRLKAEKVYFKENAGWLADFERELLDFPSGEHDDQVDAFAYITQIITNTTNKNKTYSTTRKKTISTFDF